MVKLALAIDALSPQLTGIGRYTWELCKHLPPAPELESVRFYRYGRWFEDPAWFLRTRKPPRSFVPPFLGRLLAKREFGNVLFHSPNFFLPRACDSGIVTVHDLSVIRYPHLHPKQRVREFESGLMDSIARASHVITVSKFVAKELTELAGVAPQKISPIPLGISEAFLNAPERVGDLEVLRRYGLDNTEYCLCVSTIEPRKGIDHAINAVASYIKRRRKRIKLVIVGAPGWNNAEIVEKINCAIAQGIVVHLGYVAEADIPIIYRGAKLLLYPSQYEGFGLPIVEAMAMGTPVITSNVSCLPETAQGAAMLIDPRDVGLFEDAIGTGLEDEGWRETAVQAGKAVAATYSWEACAAKTVQVYCRYETF